MLLVPLHTLAARMLQNTKRIVRPHSVLCHRKQRLDIRVPKSPQAAWFSRPLELGDLLGLYEISFHPLSTIQPLRNSEHRKAEVCIPSFIPFCWKCRDRHRFHATHPYGLSIFVAIVTLSMPPVASSTGFESFITPRSFSGHL